MKLLLIGLMGCFFVNNVVIGSNDRPSLKKIPFYLVDKACTEQLQMNAQYFCDESEQTKTEVESVLEELAQSRIKLNEGIFSATYNEISYCNSYRYKVLALQTYRNMDIAYHRKAMQQAVKDVQNLKFVKKS